MVNQRYVIQAWAVFVPHRAAISSLPHVVKVGHTGSADQGARNRCPTIGHRSGRKQRRDGDATIRRIERPLVAVPTDCIVLCVALGAAITDRRNSCQHLGQGLLALALKRCDFGRRTCLSSRRAAPFLRWSCDRSRIDCIRYVTGGNGHLVSSGTFAGMEGGAIATQMADQLIPKGRLDQRLMPPFRVSALGEFRERPREWGGIRILCKRGLG
jgi:hypothetical protein